MHSSSTTPPLTWGKKGMPARACPERRKAITATDEQHGMKGQTRGNKKTTEVKHNTQKKTKTKHTHVTSRVQVCCMPRYATQRTRDENGNQANKSKR